MALWNAPPRFVFYQNLSIKTRLNGGDLFIYYVSITLGMWLATCLFDYHVLTLEMIMMMQESHWVIDMLIALSHV